MPRGAGLVARSHHLSSLEVEEVEKGHDGEEFGQWYKKHADKHDGQFKWNYVI
jgi:hypothetical protein